MARGYEGQGKGEGQHRGEYGRSRAPQGDFERRGEGPDPEGFQRPLAGPAESPRRSLMIGFQARTEVPWQNEEALQKRRDDDAEEDLGQGQDDFPQGPGKQQQGSEGR